MRHLWLIAVATSLAGCENSAPDFAELPVSRIREAASDAPMGAAVADAQPTLLEHDFGVVRPGQRCEHVFKFANPTATPLRSARIRRSCSCTVAEITPPVIEPGAEAQIRVAYAAPQVAAADSKSMAVQFQDVPALSLQLRIEATIRPRLYMKLAPNVRDARPDDFHVTHDLGNEIGIGEIAGAGGVRRVTFSFPHRPGRNSGSISIRLHRAGSAEPVAQTVVPIAFSE